MDEEVIQSILAKTRNGIYYDGFQVLKIKYPELILSDQEYMSRTLSRKIKLRGRPEAYDNGRITETDVRDILNDQGGLTAPRRNVTPPPYAPSTDSDEEEEDEEDEEDEETVTEKEDLVEHARGVHEIIVQRLNDFEKFLEIAHNYGIDNDEDVTKAIVKKATELAELI